MTQRIYHTIELALDESQAIAQITFNRPDVRNALNLEMVDEIRGALHDLVEKQSVKALIFTGAEDKAFVSGADIAELKERTKIDALRRINGQLFREIEQTPFPTIAAINGYALGGGCELALACDLRVAADHAKFGQPEVGLGILPGAGATYRLPRVIGLGHAKELIFTGNIIDAAEAYRIGLVNHVVPSAALLETARQLATRIAQNSASAIYFSKLALNASREVSVDAAMMFESTAQAVLFDDDEKHQRMAAFLGKRKPR